MLGRGVTPPRDKIDAEQFQRYFNEKVAGVRSTTAGAPLPSFEQSSTDMSFNCFQTVTLNEVVAAVKVLPDKSCTLDPLPTKLLKAAVDVISPFLTELFNRSLSQGHVPDSCKIAQISPRLKRLISICQMFGHTARFPTCRFFPNSWNAS